MYKCTPLTELADARSKTPLYVYKCTSLQVGLALVLGSSQELAEPLDVARVLLEAGARPEGSVLRQAAQSRGGGLWRFAWGLHKYLGILLTVALHVSVSS